MFLKRLIQIYHVKLLDVIVLDSGYKKAKFEIKGLPCFL
jgi:hypothetical protein